MLKAIKTRQKVKKSLIKSEELIAKLTAERNRYNRSENGFEYWQDKINNQRAISEVLREVL